MKRSLALAATLCLFISAQQLHAAEVVELYHACKSGKAQKVHELISHAHKLVSVYGKTALYLAAKHNRLEVVRYLIEQCGYNADGDKDKEYTPLVGAAMQGSEKVAQYLINAGADVNKRTPLGGTPLHFAAESGHLGITQLLIKAGADVGDTVLEGTTPLYIAARYGNLNVLQHLIEMGADVNTARQNGETPLHVAAHMGHHEVIRLLIRRGVNIEALYKNKTPLQLAIQEQNVQAAQCLIRAGAAVTEQDLENARDKNCFVEILSGLINFLQDHREELAKYQAVMQRVVSAKRYNMQEWLTTEHGKLCAAVSRLLFTDSIVAPQEFFKTGCREINRMSWTRRFFEEKKLTPIAINLIFNQFLSMPERDSNVTHLHAALCTGDLHTVKKLIFNEQIRHAFSDNFGKLPLHFALEMNQYEVVRFLIKNKIYHVNCPLKNSGWSASTNRTTPLCMAAQHGYRRIAQFLIKSGADVDTAIDTGETPLFIAAKYGQAQLCRILLKGGARPDTRASKGLTPLHRAMIEGHEKVIQILLDHGATIDHPLSRCGLTLLHAAAESGNLRVALRAIQAGADPNKTTKKGETPLFKAAQEGHLEVVKLLLQAGASVNTARNSGATPLLMASSYNFPRTVELLIEAGAEVDKATINGATPLWYASKKGHHEVVDILLQAGAQPDIATSPPTPLGAAYTRGHHSIIKLLLYHGAHVDQLLDEDGATLLCLAALDGNQALVRAAILAGADVNKAGQNGLMPLHAAVNNEHTEISLLLILAGADVNARFKEGHTALHVAAAQGNLAIVAALLQAGACIDARAHDGATPLNNALRNKHLDVVRFLIQSGACLISTILRYLGK